MTTVRGITSRVDIVWSRSGREIRKLEDQSPALVTDQLVTYGSNYSITQLSTSYDGHEFQCKVVINSPVLVTAGDNIILNVSGECVLMFLFRNFGIWYVCSQKSLMHAPRFPEVL